VEVVVVAGCGDVVVVVPSSVAGALVDVLDVVDGVGAEVSAGGVAEQAAASNTTTRSRLTTRTCVMLR
jgi:hypothetical protein